MIIRSLTVIFLSAALISCSQNEQPNVKIETAKDSASYAVGYNIGRNIKSQVKNINNDVFLKGLTHAVNGDSSLFSEIELAHQVQSYQKQLVDKKNSEVKAIAEKNLKEGEAFLAENKTKDGVVTTATGLQYKILKKGNGPQPKKTDKVAVNYEGKLLDGRVFDSSIKRGKPSTFGVSQAIPGLTEALQLMPVGSKWELYIPPSLGYGSRQSSERIGPNSTLIFEVELLKIEK